MLRFYAERLRTVELNTTFYGNPAPRSVAAWARAVPANFRFAVKAHRGLTYGRRLRASRADIGLLLESLAPLDPWLGPVLFQLPATAEYRPGVIEGFLPLLPNGWRVAFQFRHPSWHASHVVDQIEQAGAAICHGDGEAEPGPLGRGPFVYLRFRRDSYTEEDLEGWAAQLDAWVGGGRDVFAYFKHERLGPGYAQAILNRCAAPSNDRAVAPSAAPRRPRAKFQRRSGARALPPMAPARSARKRGGACGPA